MSDWDKLLNNKRDNACYSNNLLDFYLEYEVEVMRPLIDKNSYATKVFIFDYNMLL